MNISLVAENREDNATVLTPFGINQIVDGTDCSVLVEENAGVAIDESDETYRTAGAVVVNRATAYGKADMIIRRSAPTKEELMLLQQGSICMAMIHPHGCPETVKAFEETRTTGLALDRILDTRGERAVYLPDITAENGMKQGYTLIDKDPAECRIAILGYGNLGQAAIAYASRQNSDVTVLNRKHLNNVRAHLEGIDIVVNAIRWPHEKRGKEFPVSREDIRAMRDGSVLVDLIVNPAGMSPIETCRPTSIHDLHYVEEGVIHTCCWGWPGLSPRKTSRNYSLLIPSRVIELVEKGALNVSPGLRNAFVNEKDLNEGLK